MPQTTLTKSQKSVLAKLADGENCHDLPRSRGLDRNLAILEAMGHVERYEVARGVIGFRLTAGLAAAVAAGRKVLAEVAS